MFSGVPAAKRAPRSWRGGTSRWLAAWPVAIGVALAASCHDERLPPPRNTPPPAASSSASTGAGGGDVGVDAGADAAGPRNVCACVAAYGGEDGPCADCFNAQAASGAACGAERSACDADPACRSISLCLKGCGRSTTCQSDCIFPEDAGREHAAFRRVLACVCAACGATCAYPEPLPCLDDGGIGGSGGAGLDDGGPGDAGLGDGGLGDAGGGGAQR